MRPLRSGRVAAILLSVAVALPLVIAGGGAPVTSAAATGASAYLALGDSVTFGFVIDDGGAYGNARNFPAYPDAVAGVLGLAAVNAACPGEATGSFLHAHARDNGCRSYRVRYPLHVPYSGTQMAFALAFLQRHREVRLVTLMLGANDLFMLDGRCRGNRACIRSGLPSVLAGVSSHVAAILARIRASGYNGVLMIVDYYSTDYANPSVTLALQALDDAEVQPAAHAHALVADVFGAFRAASGPDGSACRAGLLQVAVDGDGCDFHPSSFGQELIALTVEQAYAARRS